MKDSYFESYRRIIASYSRSFSFLRSENQNFDLNLRREFANTEIEFLKIIEDSIYNLTRETEIETGIVIRPDAILFLMINFHQLVILPIYEEASTEFIENRSSYRNILQLASQDLIFILNKSVAFARQKDKREVSSHIIIDVLSANWSKLKSSKLEIWG